MKGLLIAVGAIVCASALFYSVPSGGEGSMRTTPDLWIPSSIPLPGQLIPTGPIRSGHTISQSFVAEKDRLCAIEFLGATYGIPISSGTIRVTIVRSGVQSPGTVAVRQIDARSIADNHYVRVDFPPVPDSAGQHFVMSIEPQNVPPGAMFAVWLTQKDTYRNGEVLVDNSKPPGDLVMTVIHQSSVVETVTSCLTVFSVSVLIAVYFWAIGLAVLLMFKAEAGSLVFVAPAVGMALVGVVSAAGVLAHKWHSINLIGGILLVCFAAATLLKRHESLRSLQLPRPTVFLYVALLAVSCCITSQPQAIPRTEPLGDPWRSFVPMYPADGLIPYESASIVANQLKPSAFVFEPRWSIADRTHLLTLLYLHVCQFFGVTPVHTPQGPWEIVDRSGFWLLRSLAFATNSLVLFGLAAVGSAILDRAGRLIVPALAVLSPFFIFNTFNSWPKFLCSYLILIGIYLLIRRRAAWAGALFALAYWAHPMANLFCLGGCVFTWMLGKNRRASARSAATFAGVVALGVGTTIAFSSGAFHARGGSFYLYPLATGYHAHSARDATVVLRDFHATPVADVLAIRLVNLIRFVFPTDLARSQVGLEPGHIWEGVRWDWLRIYAGSVWGSTGLLLFPVAVFGVYLSRQRRETWAIAFAFMAVPAVGYVVWMGFPMDLGGITSCQPITLIAVIFASIALQSCRQRAAIVIAAAVALEMQFALSIPYEGGAAALALTGLCLAGVGTIWAARRPIDTLDITTTLDVPSREVSAVAAAAASGTQVQAAAPVPRRKTRPHKS
jgi:hypothetical protein